MSKNSGVERVLVVGGGFSGMTAALQAQTATMTPEIVEIDPNWQCYGAGISLHGATLRVLQQIGLYEGFLAVGAVADGFDVRSPATDDVLMTLPTPRVAEGVAGGAAIMRPALAELLRTAVIGRGIKTRLGQSVAAIDQTGDGVEVVFANGERDRYDLVIGADGLNSSLRKLVFPSSGEPAYAGQGAWRAVTPTPDGIERGCMWPGPLLKAGINPVSRDMSYIFVTEARPTKAWVAADELQEQLSALLDQFGSPMLRRIRDQLGPGSGILYRPQMQFLMQRPWSVGGVVLIGDAVHSTTPHLAAGACIGMEDAVVLVEELSVDRPLSRSLAAFEERRWERCRMVVENSGRLCQIEITGGDRAEHTAIMRTSMAALAQPV